MKPIMLLLFIASSLLQASVVNCTPPQSTVVDGAVAGSQDFTCPGDPAATKARLILSGSFQDNSSAGPELSVRFSAPAVNGLPTIECTAIGTTFGDQTLGACTAIGEWVDVTGLADFLVSVTGGAGSDPLPFNASASVRVETDTPEPGVFALIGFGLMSFAGLRSLRRMRP